MAQPVKVIYEFPLESPANKSLVKDSKAYVKKLLEQVKLISKKVRRSPVKEVADYILENMCLRIIEEGDAGTIRMFDVFLGSHLKKGQNAMPVAFFVDRISVFASHMEQRNPYACYVRAESLQIAADSIWNFVALRDPKNFTPFFQAVNLFHETVHLMDHRRFKDYHLFSNNEREVPAHAVEIMIMLYFGGKELCALTAEYVEKIARESSGNPSEKEAMIERFLRSYDPRLDTIFSPAASDMERRMRMDRFVNGFVCNENIGQVARALHIA